MCVTLLRPLPRFSLSMRNCPRSYGSLSHFSFPFIVCVLVAIDNSSMDGCSHRKHFYGVLSIVFVHAVCTTARVTDLEMLLGKGGKCILPKIFTGTQYVPFLCSFPLHQQRRSGFARTRSILFQTSIHSPISLPSLPPSLDI